MAEIFTAFYQYQIGLNLFHFQTNSYAGHKTSDMHLTRFREHFDMFLEVFQGIFGKINMTKSHRIEFGNLSKTSQIIKETQKLNEFLEILSGQLSKYGDLVNIIDEIIADNHQFLYLLTFD